MTPEALIVESFFRVVTKDGEDADFILNPTQRELDENLSGRDLIPKARQEGVSTYFLARYTAACLSRRNVRAVIISHESDATSRLLQRAQYFLDNFKGDKPVVGRSSRNEITFPKTNSHMYIGTAGSKKFGRGDTITHLHCSEYAFWPDAKTLMTGLLQAVPMSGEIAIESTGNGIGNDYHKRCMRAAAGASQWRLHFFNWLTFPEYRLSLSDEEREWLLANLDRDLEEDKLIKILDLEQIAWRRMKLEELDYDMTQFKQEYPITLDECFQATGRSIFYKVNYIQTKEWKQSPEGLWYMEPHPNPRLHYSVGVDPSGGVGRDNAAIQVFCCEAAEQVGEWAHNRTAPDDLAYKAAEIGRLFNEALITVESNNHGLVTLDELMEIYPMDKVYDSGAGGGGDSLPIEEKTLSTMGLRTTQRSKPIIIGRLRSFVAKEGLIHSPFLKSEMDTFVETDKGKLEAEEGCYDDRVMAAAMSVWGMIQAGFIDLDTVGPSEKEMKNRSDPFTLDAIIEEMQGRQRLKPRNESAYNLNAHWPIRW